MASAKNVSKKVAKKYAFKKVAKKHAFKKVATKSSFGMRPVAPAGFTARESGLLVPTVSSAPIPASKLRTGLRAARRQIDDSLDELIHIVAGPYRIASIELEVSFSADGKFLGFGVGGATTLKLTIVPDADG